MPESIDDIPGWFQAADRALIDWLLAWQAGAGITGDLCELGVYLGKSAVAIGAHLRDGERFTVCDLFDLPAPDLANAAELTRSYANLTRAAFERNYLAFHPSLPVIVAGPTSTITAHVAPGSCRFIHVDASHHYRHVRDDVASARALLGEGGVVVFDDYRAAHTPGVAAAVWQAVTADALVPLWLSPNKMYAMWSAPGTGVAPGESAPGTGVAPGESAPGAPRAALAPWLTARDVRWEVEDVAGHEVIVISSWPR